MRNISDSRQAELNKFETTEAIFLKVEPIGGPPIGFTSHDQSHTIDGIFYDAESSNAPARIPAKLKMGVDTAETIFLPGSFDFQLLKLGFYEGAKITIYQANYNNTVLEPTLMAGTLGQAEIRDNLATVQFDSLAAPANKPCGRQTGPLCDCPRFGRGLCENSSDIGGDNSGPSIATYTVVGTVTAVESAQRFTLQLGGGILSPSAALALLGWSQASFLGIVRATSGANYNAEVDFGKEEVVKSFNALTGELVLRLPLPFVPDVDDTFDCERGCDKAWETCKTQPDATGGANNYANFMGFPFVPIDKVTKRRQT